LHPESPLRQIATGFIAESTFLIRICTMPELSSLNPTGRFTGLAETYARFRPSYPAHGIDFIMARCGLDTESILVDVGCGTGIASRLFAARGINVIGIEPNMEMRCTAAAEEGDDDSKHPSVTYREGRAESTGLEVAVADAVLSAQAFHWFEPVATLREFHRILKLDGWAILMWNERDEQDPATAAYGAVIRTADDAGAIEGSRQTRAGEVLRTSPFFRHVEQVKFHNQQAVDEEGLLGRAFSVSYAPRETSAREAWADRLKAVFNQYERNGEVVLRYQTTIYLARRYSR
jgi:SAM-dependent methyltransferase